MSKIWKSFKDTCDTFRQAAEGRQRATTESQDRYWYEPFIYDRDNTHTPAASHSGTAILTVNMMSYVIAAVIFAPGPPYRKNFLSNKLYVTVIVAEFILVSYLTIYPADAFSNFINLKPSPFIEYHLVLYVLSLANFIVSYIWEIFFIQGFLFEYVVPALRRLRGPIHKYEKLQKELEANSKWPPVGRYEIAKLKDEYGSDEVDAAITRHSSRRYNWTRQSSDLRHSMLVGLKLAKSSETDDSPDEALSFVTFKDGRHKVNATVNNSQDFV
ncbi:probable cation-transporting ATPase 13A4 [Stegodyphus dumicola]|uniref:probable cation-transporting ATPase 13A4 n=1 Tax=Stegodyphus dumicola TaxID=202533 RepID=UPI0015AC0DA9|nr:probable cation-transporting ATPase 13A4 [Stegodyphus dumicola]